MKQPNDESVRADVEHFCSVVHRLKSLRYTFNALYVRKQDKSLIEKAAALFFSDLNQTLIDVFLLELAKLTDPATIGRFNNLTVDYFLSSVEWPAECLIAIENAKNVASALRKHIEPARNKIIAHYDVQAIASGQRLGSFPEGLDEEVIAALEVMCNELHRASTGSIYGAMCPGNIGDVHDLKSRLIDGIAFQKLMDESRGEDLDRLLTAREAAMAFDDESEESAA